MANTELENPLGFCDKRRTQAQGDMPGTLDSDNRYLSVSSLRASLNARNSTYYTFVKMESMTKNDLIYALRTIDDAAGIK